MSLNSMPVFSGVISSYERTRDFWRLPDCHRRLRDLGAKKSDSPTVEDCSFNWGAELPGLSSSSSEHSPVKRTGSYFSLWLSKTSRTRSGGADAGRLARSIPMEKIRDDVLVAYGQNGEALRPEQGYPGRLIVPGWDGNTNIKWLGRI